MTDSRRAWWTVARWELSRTLRRADFIVSVLLTPALIIGVIAGTQWMAERAQNRVHAVAIARAGDAPRPNLVPGVRWIQVSGMEARRDSLLQSVRERRYDGALLVPSDFGQGGTSELFVRREIPGLQLRIAAFLKAAAREQRAAAHGLDSTGLKRLDANVALQLSVSDPQARSSKADRTFAIVLTFLLMIVTFMAGIYTMVGISSEKQARVTEIVISSIPAQAWMDGKIVAYTVLGLITGVVWAVVGVSILLNLAHAIPASLNASKVAFVTLYGVLGFALYVSFFAAAMSTLKDFHSASKLQGNFMIVPALPMFLTGPIVESPEAGFAIATSLIPFFSPMLMPMRIALGQAPLWQILLGLALLVGSVWLMRKLAGTVFRIGMLLYGKDVNLPELIRLARQR